MDKRSGPFSLSSLYDACSTGPCGGPLRSCSIYDVCGTGGTTAELFALRCRSSICSWFLEINTFISMSNADVDANNIWSRLAVALLGIVVVPCMSAMAGFIPLQVVSNPTVSKHQRCPRSTMGADSRNPSRRSCTD